MIKSTILASVALALVAGCAAYEPGGFYGGFNDVPLASDTYRIQGYGNSFGEFNFTSRAQTNAIALVRAAELAAEHGYERFVVLEYNEWAKTKTYSTPTTATTTTTLNGRANYIGWGANYSGESNSTTTIDPGSTYDIDNPRTDIVVRFVANGSRDAAKALLAGEIIARYGPIAGLKPEQVAALINKSPRSVALLQTADFGALHGEAPEPTPEVAEPPPESFGPPQLTRRVSNRY